MENKLTIHGKKKTLVFPYEDILYLQGEGRYTRIVTKNENKMVCKHLKLFEEKLECPPFFRVFKSFLVNTSKITKVIGRKVYVDHIKIPVSRDKLTELKNILMQTTS